MSKAVNLKSPEFDMNSFHGALHKAINKPYHEHKVGRSEHSSKWAEAKINGATKSIAIKVYLNFKSQKLIDVERTKLISLATDGIERYWSRDIVVDGKVFEVNVSAQHSADSTFSALLKIEKQTEKYGRSFNPGVLGVDARFIYNSGYFPDAKYSDEDFKLVCAHEFGHSVLKAAGGISLSWGHKGSTGVVSQAIKRSTPGYPASGPIDLMKYYDDKKQKASFSQLINDSLASERDVMRLIWLSRISWK